MSIYLSLLLLACLVVWVVDCSGFTDTLLGWASKFTARYGYGPVRSLRPFTCSLCATWWSGIVYALAVGQFSLPVLVYIAALAGFSKTLAKVFIFITEGADCLLGKLMERWMED
jgi:hypothetical protein